MDGQDAEAVDGPDAADVDGPQTVRLTSGPLQDALWLLAGRPPAVDAVTDVWLAQCAEVLDGLGMAIPAVADGLAVLEDVDAAVAMLEDVDSVGAPALRSHVERTAGLVGLLAASAARRWLALSGLVVYRHGPDAVDYQDVEDRRYEALAAVQTWTVALTELVPPELLGGLLADLEDAEDVDRG